MQRKEENKLHDEVTKKNLELSEKDAENWLWKVLGRREERRKVKAKVEETSLSGAIVEADPEVEM